jgi:Protein of unknown function (DUF3024)
VTRLPELDVKRLERYFADRIPAHVRDQIRNEVTTRGTAVTLWECRPPWRADVGAEWTRTKIAQLRYDPEHLTWTMFWADQHDKWLAYPGTPPTANFDRVIEEIDRDPYACFWG